MSSKINLEYKKEFNRDLKNRKMRENKEEIEERKKIFEEKDRHDKLYNSRNKKQEEEPNINEVMNKNDNNSERHRKIEIARDIEKMRKNKEFELQIEIEKQKTREIQNNKNKFLNVFLNRFSKNNGISLESFLEESKNPYNIFIPEKSYKTIINELKEIKVNTICNVYQSMYKNRCSSGFGDFIRGSYFLLEFGDKHGFNIEIIFNSCISIFLKNVGYNYKNFDQTLFSNISKFQEINATTIILSKHGFVLNPIKNPNNTNLICNYFYKECPIHENKLFMYTICYPNTINIPPKHKIIMQHILEPIDQIREELNMTLSNLDLEEKNFFIIQVRSGDDYLKNENKAFNPKYVDNLLKNIKIITDSYSNKYLLIADNNDIKKIILNYFPFFKTELKSITHFGEGFKLEEEKVKNTLIDFYLLSLSSRIFSLTNYQHGSGFSQWCASTYNIPYTCRYIPSN